MHFCLISEAWHPQVNGVVRTWSHVKAELEAIGHTVCVIHPGLFRTVAMPGYAEVRLAVMPGRALTRLLDAEPADAVHIATEGPLGLAARRWCLRRGTPFTTSYHTQFPMYLKRYLGVPEAVTWRHMRRFHAPANAVLCPTPRVAEELKSHGLNNAVVWMRGVDGDRFTPQPWCDFEAEHGLQGPIWLYCGRVSLEKNIEAFLALDLPGSKVIVGDGPVRARLQAKHPDALWLGYRPDTELSRLYAGADVKVFPSLTDTFGVVMLEANACGTPVAAYPVTGPIDVIRPGVNGELDDDLHAACLRALHVSRAACREHAVQHTWRRTAQMVLEHAAVRERERVTLLAPA